MALDDTVPVRIIQLPPSITGSYVGFCLTQNYNRNFQNVSAFARGQIEIGIELRFPKDGLPPVGDLGFALT